MGSSDAAAIERLTADDLADCLALSADAGWNQVAADWRIFLRHGLVWGIRADRRVVATAALLPYPPATAWISMVLTAVAARGRGFATRLMRAAIEESAGRGLVPQLDATPVGQPVYERLGFGPVLRLTRWRREGTGARQPAAPRETSAGDTMHRLDAQALRFDRPWLLRALAGRGPAAMRADAFALSRDGRTAHQIGPVAARAGTTAEAVTEEVLHALGPEAAVLIDANDARPQFAEFLRARGFRPERPFLRMARGEPPRPDTDVFHAAAGPELG